MFEFLNNRQNLIITVVATIIVLLSLVCISFVVYELAKKEEIVTKKEKYENYENYENDKIEVAPQGPVAEIVLYYATWCGYSKQFLPQWDKFEKYAKENLPSLKVTKIRCEGGMEAECFQKQIQGYPTVVLYKDNKQKMFELDRTFEKLVEFSKNNL